MSEPGPEVVVPEGETPAEVGGCTAV
jgi:hypothetical protein